MIRVGDRVRLKETGQRGKALRVITIVHGIVLNRPLAVIRLEDPDPMGVTLTTAFEDELEVEGPAAAREAA